jgi:hypothetical protein
MATLQEALDKALAATLYYHRIESLKPAVRTLEVASKRMFIAQAYEVLLAVYGADLSEATQQEKADKRRAAIILAAITAALARRLSRDVALLQPGLAQALAIAVANAGLAKHGILANLRSVRAEKWIAEHGAELVTGINEFTREQMAIVLRDAFRAGKSVDAIAGDLMLKFGEMNYARAYRIAVTESAKAWSHVELEHAAAMEDAGFNMLKEWILNPLHPRYDECDMCSDAGAIPIKMPFPTGDQAPPQHPSCGCCLTSYPDTAQDQPWGATVFGLTPVAPFGGQGEANAS